jgi:ATP-dependent helicase/DNAse subunit B
VTKEIWLGPLLGNNRSRLIERCAQLVSTGQANTFLYLAASHPLLELVTEQLFDGARNKGCWGELPVYLFRGFIRRVLTTAVDKETGLPLTPRTPIDREQLPLKRSLISQLLQRLAAQGKLQAIGPLARRDGCVNTVATLIGEIQRAGVTSAELQQVIAKRANDYGPNVDGGQGGHADPLVRSKERRKASASQATVPLQIDFDRDMQRVYSAYCALLDQHNLTEDDADQLRALHILRGAINGSTVDVPWLADVRLLVLDGFFDFTPVQGEMLRRLIPRIPEVIVNINHDERNPEIFRPFRETIELLEAIAPFQREESDERAPVTGALGSLRERLFNPGAEFEDHKEQDGEGKPAPIAQTEIKYLECTDRDTELREIAKEIKRLVLQEDFALKDIALVVRERASYAETIARVMREESVACDLARRLEPTEIPAVRAALKLLALLEECALERKQPQATAIADLIKAGYFRLADEVLAALAEKFNEQHAHLLGEANRQLDAERQARLRQELGIGHWDADALENVIAFVGSELRIDAWLERGRKLIAQLPAAGATRDLLNIESSERNSDDEADAIEGAETAPLDMKGVEKKRRPSRDVSLAAIAWASLVIEFMTARIQEIPREGRPVILRAALMSLLEQFQFNRQIRRTIRKTDDDREVARAMLDLHGLEALRRAFAAAIKSIEWSEPPAVAGGPVHNSRSTNSPATTPLPVFIDELRRCLTSQTQIDSGANRSGLRIFEATDVRGLRFRAVFIAGLVEGGFPLRATRDWIYPHEERERLKRYGLTLEDISPATLLKEEVYFYQAACRATERLYLSRPLLLEDDSETVASYYVEEVRRAVAPFEIKTETVRRDYDGKEITRASNAGEMAVGLVRQEEQRLYEQRRHRSFLRSDLLSLAQIDHLLLTSQKYGCVSQSAQTRIAIERQRAGYLFGPYDGEITNEDLLALLRERFGPDHPHSASSLSTFGNCPYRFFAQRVLRLEPRGEAALDLQALDAGKLLHDVLRRFFERHRRQRLPELDSEALRAELRKIADDVFDEHERVVPPLNRRIWEIDREIRKIILDQVLLYEIELQQTTASHDIRPAYFELAFGMPLAAADPHSVADPLELTRATAGDEDRIRINGQIDRVDVANDETLIAYDYKLSSGASKDDIRSGRTMQIPIYLEALERLILPEHELAGGGYYILRGGGERRNRGLYRADYAGYTKLTARNSVFSDHDWQQIRAEVIAKIWSFFDQMRAGNFRVTPSEGYKTCRFCDYPAVCRYDKYRIERKIRNASDA